MPLTTSPEGSVRTINVHSTALEDVELSNDAEEYLGRTAGGHQLRLASLIGAPKISDPFDGEDRGLTPEAAIHGCVESGDFHIQTEGRRLAVENLGDDHVVGDHARAAHDVSVLDLGHGANVLGVEQLDEFLIRLPARKLPKAGNEVFRARFDNLVDLVADGVVDDARLGAVAELAVARNPVRLVFAPPPSRQSRERPARPRDDGGKRRLRC